jgi:thiosulfate/3-mercaptopyruvate sulfurtransferase
MSMIFTTLISAQALRALQAASQPLVLLDCGFDLADPAAGARAFAQGHLPGAIYAHLDHDLSGARSSGNGRHPLPSRADFAATAGRWGIRPGAQVVAYDAHGAAYAARAWWLLRWIGHEAVAVLDGGVQAWLDGAGVLASDAPPLRPAPSYPDLPAAMATIDSARLQAELGAWTVLDARAPERFRGEVEPLDPVAGHIPGALNRFFRDNLGADGRFRPTEELRQVFAALPGGPQQVVHQCGSGVTACHNVLAAMHAGLPGGLLYPGSWSEWCADPARPVARGSSGD